MNEEYMKLFNKIQENKEDDELKPLNETPNYGDMPSLNETPDLSQYQINENVNDGWDSNFVQFETRINGISQNQQPQNQQIRKKRSDLDLNGLNQFLPEENLNEVFFNKQQENLTGPINEKFEDVGIVSVEMFERINEQALIPLGQKSKQVFNTYR